LPKSRVISDRIWRDEWFVELEPDAKLLFVYLFSNENTNLAGIYRFNPNLIVSETGLPYKRVLELLRDFERDRKVFSRGNLLWVVNLRRYNATSSNTVAQRIRSDLEAIPDCPLKRAYLAYYNGNPDWAEELGESAEPDNRRRYV